MLPNDHKLIIDDLARLVVDTTFFAISKHTHYSLGLEKIPNEHTHTHPTLRNMATKLMWRPKSGIQQQKMARLGWCNNLKRSNNAFIASERR